MAYPLTIAITLKGRSVPPSDLLSVSYDEYLMQEVELATASSDSEFSLGGVATVDVLYFKSDQQVTINLNSSSGTDITVDANKPVLLCGTSITALYVSNSSGSTANIVYGVWGT